MKTLAALAAAVLLMIALGCGRQQDEVESMALATDQSTANVCEVVQAWDGEAGIATARKSRLASETMGGDRQRILEPGCPECLSRPINTEEVFEFVSKRQAGLRERR